MIHDLAVWLPAIVLAFLFVWPSGDVSRGRWRR
jgi:hypothetical protein